MKRFRKQEKKERRERNKSGKKREKFNMLIMSCLNRKRKIDFDKKKLT